MAPGFAYLSMSRIDGFLQIHLLEHRFDDQIGVLDLVDADRAFDQTDALGHVGFS